MKQIILFIVTLLFVQVALSQQERLRIEDVGFLSDTRSSNDGKIELIQDTRLLKVIKRRIKLNNNKFPGWRVQIFFGTGQTARSRASRIKQNFLFRFGTNYDAYLDYDPPYFKVKVGDFRTKAEALNFEKKLSPYFKSTWIIQDKVNYPEEN